MNEANTFGHEVPVVYRELDGVPLKADGKLNRRIYNGGTVTPNIIATALALYGKNLRTVGVVVEAKVRKGYVLHMGSIGWARGVTQGNRNVCKIVLNAYRHCRDQAAQRGLYRRNEPPRAC
ncbi:MAG: hypothetical protein JO056_01770 [Alphaproteobacteria bacterium]|nr:hypothetical protein [Alphaproteobacteria bacterium]